MLRPTLDHPFGLLPAEAAALQRRLAPRAVFARDCDLRRIRFVLATDVAYSEVTNRAYGAAVLWDLHGRTRRARAGIGVPVAEAAAELPVRFPYVPGLLTFREAPVLIEAIARLPRAPVLLLVEGHGRAHPRRFGLATHLGVLYGVPSVGCAKTRLIGRHEPPADRRGAWSALRDDGEIVGAVLRTRAGVRPVFVSQGHRVDLAQARRLVLRLAAGYRMPEPLRQAHRLATESRRAGGG